MCRLCAGVVTYNPDLLRLELNLNSIADQVEEIYLIDNNSKNIEEIIKLTNKYKNARVKKNESNRGIANALNQMSKIAFENGFDWILTLDQDTISPDDMIKKMKYYISDKYGIICPGVLYEGKERIKSERELEYPYACMTSASLTQLKAWKNVGGFRDDFFIDFVDNDFCMKLSLYGYKILRINSIKIMHQLGELRTLNLFGLFNLKYYWHSDLRYYYMARNNRVFIDDYKDFINVHKEFCKLSFILLQGIFYSSNKVKTLSYIKRGLIDAKKRKMGKCKM